MIADEEKVLKLEEVTEILREVVIKENVVDPVYEISSGAAKGDGFTSFMTKVIVRGKNKVLPLIVKCAPKITSMRETLPIRVSFLQEIRFYEEVFPAFKAFQLKKRIADPFKSVPMCYKTIREDRNEMLILENIKEKGFQVFNKKEQMDEAHVEMVLKTYGQFHAISFAMKEQDFEGFEKLYKQMDPVFSVKHLSKDFFAIFEDGAEKLKQAFDERQESDVYNYFSVLKDMIIPIFNSIGGYKGKHGVLTHGDCWCNNMMFKYEGENSTPPIDLRLFDFQAGCLTSPIFDIAYFFYVTASQKMLDNLDKYLKIYHESLAKHLFEMGSNIEDHYPFSALKDEWKKYGKFGLILATGVYRVMLRDEDEVLDLSDNLTPKETFMKSSKQDHLIVERYRRVGLHFYKNKFL